jgi:hypothetical protein
MYSGNLIGRDHFGGLSIDGDTLKCILKKRIYDVV